MAAYVMKYARMIPSTSNLLSLYASFSTTLMLVRNIYNELVPKKVERYILEKLSSFFSREESSPCYDTFIIDDSWGRLEHNKLLEAASVYLSSKIGDQNKKVKVGKFKLQKAVLIGLVVGEKVVDTFEDIEITWEYVQPGKDEGTRSCYFQLEFEHEHREKILNEYLPFVLSTYKGMTAVRGKEKVLKLYSMENHSWSCIDFQHPGTFDTLAMDYEQKKSIRDDLDRFLARKDYYRRIGKAWKRGYLVYGPPGTGKSSLIAAMANYLQFDIYDLVLSNISSDSELRKAILYTENKSMIVIEDIDCNSEVHNRYGSDDSDSNDSSSNCKSNFSLSTLLNCIDGLWTCCGEERVIVFTTNHKDALDPALLRPGRMDMHIHMSYCSTQGFRILASNYLGIQEHPLLEEIDCLLKTSEVTPAALAEQLLTSEDADVALGEVVNFLRERKMEKKKDSTTDEEESDLQ